MLLSLMRKCNWIAVYELVSFYQKKKTKKNLPVEAAFYWTLFNIKKTLASSVSNLSIVLLSTFLDTVYLDTVDCLNSIADSYMPLVLFLIENLLHIHKLH